MGPEAKRQQLLAKIRALKKAPKHMRAALLEKARRLQAEIDKLPPSDASLRRSRNR